VRDIAPGLADGPVPGTLLSAIGGTQLHFAANDFASGLQLWLSNGTAATTQQVTAFGGPGFGAVVLRDLYSDGARTFFACDDGVSGVEPWVYDPSSSSVSFVLPYGSACAGTAGDPQIGAVGLPTIGNGSFALTVAQALPQSLALPFGSEGASNLSLGGGCRLLLDVPLVPFSALATDAAGTATFALPIPNDPTLVGRSLFFQWAVLDPLGPVLGDFSASGGLQAQIGS
jgi:ELWxxDGT repeat protein